MISEERLARWRELADRAWPDAYMPLEVVAKTSDPQLCYVASGPDVFFYHHNADRFEQALYILAGEPLPWVAELVDDWQQSAVSPKEQMWTRPFVASLIAASKGER